MTLHREQAKGSIFGTGDSICPRLCLRAASNVRGCVSFLNVLEFSWVVIAVLFIPRCPDVLCMEPSPHPPRVVTCWSLVARGLEREGGTSTCQLGSKCSAAVLPSHLSVASSFKH